MNKEQFEQESEEQHLKKIIEVVHLQLKKADERIGKIENDIKETRQDLRENSDHSIGNLWGSEAFEALAELSQFTNELNDKIVDGEEMKVKMQRLKSMLSAPYFARIDFKFDDEDMAEQIYIGKTALKEDGGANRYIYDWRSPIASVFYRFMTGRAFYEAPAGRIAGEVQLKRQYEIKDGTLEYFFDSDVHVVDEFLRKALSQNTSPQMKTIVETIQKEQDIVIRDMENELMMVQGVAGSGKTSIALHRVAYLMYTGLSQSLAPEDILIISPNSLFEQYIGNVLPELGEENADSTIWEEMATKILKRKKFQSREQFIESIIVHNRYSNIIENSMGFKNSATFLIILNRVIDDLLVNQIKFEDIYNNGKLIISGTVLKEKLLSATPTQSIKMRLRILQEYVLDMFADFGNGRVHKNEQIMIKQYMHKCASINIQNLYARLFNDPEYFRNISAGLDLPNNINKIIEWTKENLNLYKLFHDDMGALVYLTIMINGATAYRDIKQVVIDEAQDYYPLHFEVFKQLFPKAKLTVLGDINQTLEKSEDMSLYNQISQIFNKKLSNLVVMDKSFRCTSEILDFSSQFLERKTKIESFNRNGQKPEIFVLDSEIAYAQTIIDKVTKCQKHGYESIGLICKTKNNAKTLYKLLKNKLDIQLITGLNGEDIRGTFIIPVYMSKGLEFDAVLICDADEQTYCHESDKNLLYIATTRALHQLDVFCLGELSSFIVS